MNSSRCAVVLAFVAVTSVYAANQFGPWSTPVPVAVNSCDPLTVPMPAISKDGRSLYFSQVCPGGHGGLDLYVSQWDDTTGTWGPPQDLPMLNTTYNEQASALSRDGHYLYFATTRPGGLGGQDIWVSYRAQTHDDFAWQEPVPVQGINSTSNEGGPAPYQDDLGRQHMIFQSRRGQLFADFYATDQKEDGTWSDPVLIPELSSPMQDQRATVRFDGLEVIFESSRESPLFDLFVSTRPTVNDAWSTPKKLSISSDSWDEYPYLSGDGNTLYFESTRDGTEKIWMSTRERGKDSN